METLTTGAGMVRGAKRKLADSIKQLRKERGWTQDEMARHLDVDESTVSRWESGRYTPKTEHLHAILELRGSGEPGSYLDDLVRRIEEDEIRRGLGRLRAEAETLERVELGEHEILLLKDGRLLVNGHIWIDAEPGR